MGIDGYWHIGRRDANLLAHSSLGICIRLTAHIMDMNWIDEWIDRGLDF